MQVSTSSGYLPVWLVALCLLLVACGTNSRITHSYVDPTVNSMDLSPRDGGGMGRPWPPWSSGGR